MMCINFNKFRRHLYKLLSKVCLKQVESNYLGLKLKVPILHGIGAGHLVPGDNWMSDCLGVFLQKKSGAVVDIGVNIGLYLIKLKAMDQSRRYIGFEPNASCNYYTQELIRVNNFKNVSILPFALSSKKELRSFYVRKNADKMGSLNDFARLGEEGKYLFDLFTFPADDFFGKMNLESLCVIKIDVEGAEQEVLQGITGTIKKYKPYIFCEIWSIPDVDHVTYDEKIERLKSIYDILKNLQYKILGVSSKDFTDIKVLDTIDSFNGEFRMDYIFVHESEADDLRQKLIEI